MSGVRSSVEGKRDCVDLGRDRPALEHDPLVLELVNMRALRDALGRVHRPVHEGNRLNRRMYLEVSAHLTARVGEPLPQEEKR